MSDERDEHDTQRDVRFELGSDERGEEKREQRQEREKSKSKWLNEQ